MKLPYIALNTFLKERVADANQFTQLTSIALGLALGRTALLPTALKDDARTYYSQNVQANLERAAAEFNENIVIDLDLACNVARGMWLVRAGLAFPQPMIDLPEEGCNGSVFGQLSGYAHVLAPDTAQVIKANSLNIFIMANRITAVMTGESDGRA